MLQREGLADEAFFATVEKEAETLAADLRHQVLTMADPEPFSFFDHVYAEETSTIEAERRQFAAYRARTA